MGLFRKSSDTVPRRWRRAADRFLDKAQVTCGGCKRKVAIAGAEPLSVAPCPRCGYPNFVPLRVANYLLMEPVGAGGIASSYKSLRLEGEWCVCAVKLLQPDAQADVEAVQAFETEADIHSRIPPHPNIVGYLEHGVADGRDFYAMDFIAGDRLDHLLAAGRGLPEPEALYMVAELLSALTHIHDCGYLYRDVNTGNLIRRPDGHTVLIDFGLTLPIEFAYEASTSRFVWGAGQFMPPERICHGGENESSVIYSVGMLLYLMLAGEPLFKGQTLEAQARRHVASLRVAVTPDMLPQASPATVELIAAMIRQEPAERIQTFDEVNEIVLGLLGT